MVHNLGEGLQTLQLVTGEADGVVVEGTEKLVSGEPDAVHDECVPSMSGLHG